MEHSSEDCTVRGGVNGAIQIFNIAGNGLLTKDNAKALIDNKLSTPGGLEIYSPEAGKHYAVTAGGVQSNKSFVNIIDISDPSVKPSFVYSIPDSSSLSLQGLHDLDIYFTNNKHYAAVLSNSEHAVTIIDISAPTNPTIVGKITDDSNLLLRYPHSLEIYSTGGKHYAVVTPFDTQEAGIQIIDISTPESPTAVGKLEMNVTNQRYVSAADMTLHTYNDRWYALLIGKEGHNSLQIIDITDPNTPIESSHILPANTNEKILSVESYAIGERQFASVGTVRIDNTNPLPGLDILELAFLTSNAGPNQSRTHGQTVTLNGAAAVTVPGKTFSYAWTQTGGPTVNLPSSTALNPTFTAPSQDATLTFALTVTLAADQNVITSANTAGIITATDTVTITVSAIPNQAPTANAGRDKTATPESTVTLSGSGTDPDGNDADLKYEWDQTSITSETPSVNIDNRNSAQTTFTAPPDPTELEFTLTVSDRTDSATDVITITIKEQIQTRNIKELKDTLVQGQITAPNQITMIYTEPIATFINSYLNFTISGEDKPRNITGINGSPAIETGETVRINGKLVKTYSTILTFDGPPVPPGSTGSMYVQHADYYLAKIQIRDGQN